MTPAQIENLILKLKARRIHYVQMTSWSRANNEGFNEGLDYCIKQLEQKLKPKKK